MSIVLFDSKTERVSIETGDDEDFDIEIGSGSVAEKLSLSYGTAKVLIEGLTQAVRYHEERVRKAEAADAERDV